MIPLAASLWTAAGLLLASSTSLLVHHVLTPRLPLYKVQTIKLFNLVLSPWKGEVKATWRAGVSLHNDNYLRADVHAASFDIYLPNSFDGSLTHIGHVRDVDAAAAADASAVAADATADKKKKPKKGWRRRRKQQQCCKQHSNGNPANTDCIPCKLNTDENTPTKNRRKPPLWSLRPRRHFETTDDLSMTLFRLSPRTVGHLLLSLVRKGGTLVFPSTGVAHVRTGTTKTAFTVGVTCDNVLHLWSQSIVGRDCQIKGVSTGWINLEQERDRLRQWAIQRHTDDNDNDEATTPANSSR